MELNGFLVGCSEILSLTDILNNVLQKQRDILLEAIGLVKATQKKVKELRTDAAFDCIKHSAIEFAAEYGIDVTAYNYRGTGRRTTKLNSRLQGYTFVESGVGDGNLLLLCPPPPPPKKSWRSGQHNYVDKGQNKASMRTDWR